MKTQHNANDEIIHLLNRRGYSDAERLIAKSTIENHEHFSNDNVFNYLVGMFLNISRLPVTSHQRLPLLLALLNNPSFKMTPDNIGDCVGLNSSFLFHDIMIKYIKDENIIAKFSIREKTNVLLMIGESFYDKYVKDNCKRYMALFSDKDKKECQQYLLDNFESYFDNVHSDVKHTPYVALKTQELIKEILIDRTYVDEEDPKMKFPDQSQVLIGEDIKYISIQLVLADFYARQKRTKHNSACLFKSPEKFFIFFSTHIAPHAKSFNHDKTIEYLKRVQLKYNLASVSWDNRYFYGLETSSVVDAVDISIQKSLDIFGLKDLYSIHLQLKSPKFSNHSGFYFNTCTSDIYKNSHIIISHSNSFHEFPLIWCHEITHFMQFRQNNSKCFQSQTWKRLKDKIYLYEQRKDVLRELKKIFKHEPNEVLVDSVKTLFKDSFHLSHTVFSRKLKKLLKTHVISSSILTSLHSLFNGYKSHKYEDSAQYELWREISIEEGSNPFYLNKNHEIHARLNECLCAGGFTSDYYDYYCINESAPFDYIKDDLIAFNKLLSKNFR